MGRRFKASNLEYIQGSIPTSLLTTYPVTLAIYNKTPNTTEQTVVCISDDTTNSKLIEIGKRIRVGTHRYQFIVNGDTIQGGTQHSLDEYHSVIGVARSATDRQLYIDGVSVGTDSSSQTFPPNLNKITIGAREELLGISRYLDGDNAYCALWAADLTPGEKKQFDSGISPDKIRPASLLGFWKLDGIDPGKDFSGRNNHLTVFEGTKPALHPPQIKPEIKRTLKRPFYTLIDSTTTANLKRSFIPAVIG